MASYRYVGLAPGHRLSIRYCLTSLRFCLGYTVTSGNLPPDLQLLTILKHTTELCWQLLAAKTCAMYFNIVSVLGIEPIHSCPKAT